MRVERRVRGREEVRSVFNHRLCRILILSPNNPGKIILVRNEYSKISQLSS